jgi:hypothetical protein
MFGNAEKGQNKFLGFELVLQLSVEFYKTSHCSRKLYGLTTAKAICLTLKATELSPQQIFCN